MTAPNHDSERPEIPPGASGNLQVHPCRGWDAKAEQLGDEQSCCMAEGLSSHSPLHPHTLHLAPTAGRGKVYVVCVGKGKD